MSKEYKTLLYSVEGLRAIWLSSSSFKMILRHKWVNQAKTACPGFSLFVPEEGQQCLWMARGSRKS